MAKSKYIISKPDFSIVDPTKDTYSQNMQLCLNYILENIDKKKRKESVLKWANDIEDLDKNILSAMPDVYHEVSGKYCYVILSGGVLSEKDLTSLKKLVIDQINVYLRVKESGYTESDETVEEIKDDKKVVGIQEYLKEKAASVCSDFDHWVDLFVQDSKANDLSSRDIKSVFLTSNLKSGHFRFISGFYHNIILELNDVLKGEDPDLKEGYDYLTRTQIKKMLSFYEEIVSISDHLKNTGSTKKPRAKKPINTSKAASKMQYMKEDIELKIRSQQPVKIFGSKEVWIFNTKTRKLGVYVASDASGLSVKGSSIRGFSEESIEKTLRKGVKIDLQAFCNFNRTNKKNKFKEISSIGVKLKGRINEHCLILAADK